MVLLEQARFQQYAGSMILRPLVNTLTNFLRLRSYVQAEFALFGGFLHPDADA